MDAEILEEVGETWLELLDDKTETAWLLCGYEGKKISLKSKGPGGRKDCLGQIDDDSSILFGAFKVKALDKRESTISVRAKFVIFFYRAANASSMAKAKAGRHWGSIEQTFYGHHISLAVDEIHELSEREIVARLRKAGGAHQPTGYDFGEGDVGEGADEAVPERALPENPANAAPAFVKAPKAEEEGALRKLQYTRTGSEAGSVEAMRGLSMKEFAAEEAKEAATRRHALAGPGSGPATAPPETGASKENAPLNGAVSPPCGKSTEKEAAPAPEGGAGGVARDGGRVVMLVTSIPSTTAIEGNQHTLRNILKSKLSEGSFIEVDGVQPENRNMRSALFECSGMRGVYPQVFLENASDGGSSKLVAVGDFEAVQGLNDTDSLPPDVLAANPQIPTFTKTFAAFLKG